MVSNLNAVKSKLAIPFINVYNRMEKLQHSFHNQIAYQVFDRRLLIQRQ